MTSYAVWIKTCWHRISTNYFTNNNFPIHVSYLITCNSHRHVLELLSKQIWVNFVIIGNKGNGCLVIVYLLRYKGCVYISIILVGTSKLVLYSREFAITVFVLSLIFFLSFWRGFAGESKLLRYKHEFVLCVFVLFVLYCTFDLYKVLIVAASALNSSYHTLRDLWRAESKSYTFTKGGPSRKNFSNFNINLPCTCILAGDRICDTWKNQSCHFSAPEPN